MRRFAGPSSKTCPSPLWPAVLLLGAKSVDEIVARLSPAELQQVINIVGRSPGGYPPGAYAALKDKRDLAPLPRADGAPHKVAPNGQTIPRNVAAQKRARRHAALRQRAVDGEKGTASLNAGGFPPP